MSKQSAIKPESVIPVYTQNNVIAGCTTHGSASLQAHQINECHTQKQHHMNEHLAGGASAGVSAASAGVSAGGAKTGTFAAGGASAASVASGAMTIDPPQELNPSISKTANSTSNIKAAGGNLLNVHNNRQQTCGPDGEYCKNLGETTQNQNQSGGAKTKTKKNKKRKNKKSMKKLKGILKKKKERKTKTKTRSKNTKRTKKNKKRKTKKVRFSKN